MSVLFGVDREAGSCCPSLLVVYLVSWAYRIGRVALISRLKPNGNYMYRQFNIQQLVPYTVGPRFTNLIRSWKPFVKNRNVRKPKSSRDVY
jgi:hypothetical protein